MEIQPTRLPSWTASPLSPVWLAYCSHIEFRERTDQFLPLLSLPVFIGERPKMEVDSLMRLRLRSEWTLDERPPHLVTAFTDYRDAQWDSERLSASLVPEEYSTGKTNTILRVIAWTNVASLHIPIELQLTKFVLNTNSPVPGTQHVFLSCHITVTNVSARTARLHFVPELTTATRVIDRRFTQGPNRPAEYYPTNRVLPATEDEAWQAHREHNEAKRRRAEANRVK
jgi:hypothetical protein